MRDQVQTTKQGTVEEKLQKHYPTMPLLQTFFSRTGMKTNHCLRWRRKLGSTIHILCHDWQPNMCFYVNQQFNIFFVWGCEGYKHFEPISLRRAERHFGQDFVLQFGDLSYISNRSGWFFLFAILVRASFCSMSFFFSFSGTIVQFLYMDYMATIVLSMWQIFFRWVLWGGRTTCAISHAQSTCQPNPVTMWRNHLWFVFSASGLHLNHLGLRRTMLTKNSERNRCEHSKWRNHLWFFSRELITSQPLSSQKPCWQRIQRGTAVSRASCVTISDFFSSGLHLNHFCFTAMLTKNFRMGPPWTEQEVQPFMKQSKKFNHLSHQSKEAQPFCEKNKKFNH